jgi:hypothetical protein
LKEIIRITNERGQAMVNLQSHSRRIAISALALPIGAFAAYVTYLVVPEVLRVAVPAVVRSVVTQ